MSNKEATAKYKRTRKGVLTTLYNGAVQKSKRRKHPKPLYSSEEFVSRYLEDYIFLHLYEQWAIGGFTTMMKPSIDRLDNSKPYTWDNIQMVDWQTNLMNNNKLTQPSKLERPVHQLDKVTGEILNTYSSIGHASKATKANRSHIGAICNGSTIRKSSGGFKWIFKQE